VVLLGVVGQAEASGVRNRSTEIRSTIGTSMAHARTKVVDSGRKFLGLKPKNQNSNVAQNSPAVLSSSMSMQDYGDMDSPVVVDSQPAQAAALGPTSFVQKAKTAVNNVRLSAGRALDAVTPSVITKLQEANPGKRMQALRDHRFFGDTRNAISDKYNQLKARFKRNQPAATGGAVEPGVAGGSIQGAQTRRFAAAREAFGRAKQALTPSDATKEKAKALLTKLRPDRAMLANEIRGLNSKIKKLEGKRVGSEEENGDLDALQAQLNDARARQQKAGVLFQESRARLASAKKYLTPESGLLGQVATAWRNRGKTEEQRETPQNTGLFGGLRARRKMAKDAEAAEAAEANSGDASAAAAGNDSASSTAVNKSAVNGWVKVGRKWHNRFERGARYDIDTGSTTFVDGTSLKGSSAG